MEKAAVLSKTECKITLIEVVLGRKIVNFQHLVVNAILLYMCTLFP